MAYKGDIAAIAAKFPKKGTATTTADPDADDDEDSSAGEISALEDFFAKGKKGDYEGARAALKDFLAICYPDLGK